MAENLIVNLEHEINFDLLNEELAAILGAPNGTKWFGSSLADKQLTLHLNLEPDRDLIALVNDIVAKHDATKLSARQQEVKDRETQLAQLRQANQSRIDMTKYAGSSPEIRQLAEKIAWLELELAERH